MDPKHFDKLAQSVGRRKILGGALAGILGLGAAKVAGVAAKGDKSKTKAQGDKKGKADSKKKRVGKEQNVCGSLGGSFPCPLGTCCNPTAAGNNVSCTPLTALINTQVCGPSSNAAQGTCRTCAPGTRCSVITSGRGTAEVPFVTQTRCVCDFVSCADGCCAGADLSPEGGPNTLVCIRNGSGTAVSQFIPAGGASGAIPGGSFVCGVGGGACNVCRQGNTNLPCTTGAANPCPGGGTCVPNVAGAPAVGSPGTCIGGSGSAGNLAGPQIFSGCCSATGVCQAGTAATACGSGGNLCAACTTSGQGTQDCGLNQTCVSRFAPVPPPPPAATCVAPNTVCGSTCVSTLSNPNCGGCGRTCGRCQNGVCKKKRKKHKKH